MEKSGKTLGNSDRISSLSDDSICRILSYLPTKDAVRTSVLSPRWRSLFSSMSTFDFTDCLSSLPDRNVESFKLFVSRLLLFPFLGRRFTDLLSSLCARNVEEKDFVDGISLYCKQERMKSLECFGLSVPPSFDDSVPLNLWMLILLCLRVKEIVIYSNVENSLVLITPLFTCHSLVTLKLGLYGVIDVPSDVCLPNLKTLHLTNIYFADDDSIQRLISNCLALEDLVLQVMKLTADISEVIIHSTSLKRLVLDFGDRAMWLLYDYPILVINAPNLDYFKYVDQLAEVYTFSDMSTLKQADISIHNISGRSEGAAIQLFQAISNVQFLSLFIEQPEEIFPEPLKSGVVFHNLVELTIKNLGICEETWLVELLHTMPNLSTLFLKNLEFPGEEGLEGELPRLPEEVPSCLTFHLKKIKISKFRGSDLQFLMISYFLNRARVLEELMIEWYDETSRAEEQEIDGEEQEMDILLKLLDLSSISKKCHLILDFGHALHRLPLHP